MCGVAQRNRLNFRLFRSAESFNGFQQGINIAALGKAQAECRCAAAGGAKAQGVRVAPALQVTGNKTGYHAVPSANAVYHFAFWGANAVHRTGFIQQQGTIARPAYQNIACTTMLLFPVSLGYLFITI